MRLPGKWYEMTQEASRVWLRLDEVAGVIWIGGAADGAWEIVQALGRLGIGVEVETMGSRTSSDGRSIMDIWSIRVDDWRLAREFYQALTKDA